MFVWFLTRPHSSRFRTRLHEQPESVTRRVRNPGSIKNKTIRIHSLLVAFQVRSDPVLVVDYAAMAAHRSLRVELVVTLSVRRHAA